MVDLKDIKIVTKGGGTIDDTEMVKGLVFDSKASKGAGGPSKIEGAKIALIQFCISPPKTAGRAPHATDLQRNLFFLGGLDFILIIFWG